VRHRARLPASGPRPNGIASPSRTDALAAIQPAAVLPKLCEIADLRAVLDLVLGH